MAKDKDLGITLKFRKEGDKIVLDGIKNVGQGLDHVHKKSSLLSSGFKKLAAVAIAAFSISAIKNFVSSSIQEYGKQEQAEKTLLDAMKQRGIYTQKAFEHNVKYASSLQKITAYGDDAIISVQKMLTYFGVEGEMLDKLTKATLDLAAAKGMDLASAGDLVAKSVGSSTNALTRYGIEVTGAVGSTERLQTATDNITKLFGGAALAQTKTYVGKMAQLKNLYGDMKESIGGLFIPALDNLIDSLEGVITKTDELIKKNGELTSAKITGAVYALTEIFKGLWKTLSPIVGLIGLVTKSFVALAKVIGISSGMIVRQFIDIYEAAKIVLDPANWFKRERKAELKALLSDVTTAYTDAVSQMSDELMKLNGFKFKDLTIPEPDKSKVEEAIKEITALNEEQLAALKEINQKKIEIESGQYEVERDNVKQHYKKLRDLFKGHNSILNSLKEQEAYDIAAIDKKEKDASLALESILTDKTLEIYSSGYELEIAQVKKFWNEKRAIFEKAGKDITELEELRAAEIQKIRNKEAAELGKMSLGADIEEIQSNLEKMLGEEKDAYAESFAYFKGWQNEKLDAIDEARQQEAAKNAEAYAAGILSEEEYTQNLIALNQKNLEQRKSAEEAYVAWKLSVSTKLADFATNLITTEPKLRKAALIQMLADEATNAARWLTIRAAMYAWGGEWHKAAMAAAGAATMGITASALGKEARKEQEKVNERAGIQTVAVAEQITAKTPGVYGTPIEQMAAGGIITRPTVVLAGEAGPEAIMPLRRNNSIGGQVIINNYIDLLDFTQLDSIKLQNLCDLIARRIREQNLIGGI